MIKIRGGTFLHRNLKEPPSDITRPTKDIAKEGLFNSLGFSIKNSAFLDLFGGSGAIGIEAYSRGAKKVVINDGNKEAYKIICENLKSLKIEDVTTLNLDYKIALDKLQQLDIKFDFVFLDPPYKMIVDSQFIEELVKHEILNEKAAIIIETDYELDAKLFEIYNVKALKYGRNRIYILR